MSHPLRIREIRIIPLAIPMRVRFEHAAATREVADPVVVEVSGEPPFSDVYGYGETLARPYVTGETADSVVRDVGELLAPRLMDLRAHSIAEAAESLDTLPFEAGGRRICAARAAVELAVLDLAGKVFRRPASAIIGWLDARGFAPPGSSRTVRYSGIVVGSRKIKVQWFLRAQRAYGLRDFKVKTAVPGWEDKLRWASQVLERDILRGRATLRADANGGWNFQDALVASSTLKLHRVCALEQPMPPTDDHRLPELAQRGGLDLIADESLVTMEDASRLIKAGGTRVLNVRVAKVGGLIPAMRMAHLAIQSNVDVQLGCLVGETSILTAAGAALLEVCPHVRFAEGAFGTRLLREDVAAPSLRFGLGGRLRKREPFGLGVRVSREALDRLKVRTIPTIRF